MKIIVVGLGVQGVKRRRVAGTDAIASVDPVNIEAEYRKVEDVPLGDYDAALCCVPDGAKLELLTYLLENGKHVLVEKPLVAASDAQLCGLMELAQKKQVVCYTAYNHRFEPHFVRMKEVLDSKQLGNVYFARLFYGNGTAREVRESVWRDRGAGVLPDLGSHLLDTALFWFGRRESVFRVRAAHCFENQAFDHVRFDAPGTPALEFEMTLLSWRNHFRADIYGEKGSAHIDSLCKWGPSTFTLRTRVLPSGRPPEDSATLVQADPTWELEYAHFRKLCAAGTGTNIENDRWIQGALQGLEAEALAGEGA